MSVHCWGKYGALLLSSGKIEGGKKKSYLTWLCRGRGAPLGSRRSPPPRHAGMFGAAKPGKPVLKGTESLEYRVHLGGDGFSLNWRFELGRKKTKNCQKIKVPGSLSASYLFWKKNGQSWKWSLGCQLPWVRESICLQAHGLVFKSVFGMYIALMYSILAREPLKTENGSFNRHVLINYWYLLAFSEAQPQLARGWGQGSTIGSSVNTWSPFVIIPQFT